MKTVIIGLVQGLGGWLAVSLALSWLLQTRGGMRASDTIGIALFSGGAAWVGFGLLLSALALWRWRAVILGGTHGKPPVDGRQVVLVGVIDAIGALLRAPLDRSPCVVYSYQIRHESGTGRSRSVGTVARGAALTPCRIRTGSGAYRLLVVPELEATPSAAPLDICISNFLAYAATTSFIDKAGAAKERLRLWSDDDGTYRSDVAYDPLQGADTRYWIPQQQHVAPGAAVCVFGRYDKAKGGIVPSGARPTRLIVGNMAAVAARLHAKVVTHGLIGLALIGAAVLIMFAGLDGE